MSEFWFKTVSVCCFLLIFTMLSNNSYAGGYEKYHIDVEGVIRQYYVYTPNNLSKKKKHPAVIAFHAYKSDANGFRWLISPDEYADKFGYIMIYPNALNKSWNVGKGFGSTNKETDDLQFFKLLVDRITQSHLVDGNRLYAVGFSNGAQAATTMLCETPEKIAAAAIVSHTMNIDSCNPIAKVPTLLIHGKKDRMAPFYGGGKHNLASHDETVTFLREVNELDAEGVLVLKKNTVNCTQYKNNTDSVELLTCVCSDAGHTWPQGKEFMVDTLGKVNKELNANQVIFDFFEKHENKNIQRNNKNIVRVGRINPVPMNPRPRGEPVINYSRGGIPRKI
jgi:polyhydroxybutyrate depolymerase